MFIRAASTCAVVWIGVSTITALHEWSRLSDAQLAAAGTREEPQLAKVLSQFVSLQSDGGHWTFGNSPRRVGQQLANTQQMERIFTETAKMPIGDRALFDIDEQPLVEALLKLPGIKRHGDGRWHYDFHSQDVRVQVIVVDDRHGQQLHSAVAAFVIGTNDWQVWQLLPGVEPLEQDSKDMVGGILPMPNTGRRLIGRWNNSGELMLEVVSVGIPRQSLIDFWRSNGWTVEVPVADIAQGMSCERGTSQIYAWSPETGDDLETLILVKVSDSHPMTAGQN